jgi:hypothetical protein
VVPTQYHMFMAEIGYMKKEAVERFVDWLTTLTVQKEVAHNLAGGSGKAKIILCGHRQAYILLGVKYH